MTTSSLCDVCAFGQCDAKGACIYGCQERDSSYKDGVCMGRCGQNCSLCEAKLCFSCQPGFHGPSCDRKCITMCHSTGRCNRNTGYCHVNECTGGQCHATDETKTGPPLYVYLLISSSLISILLTAIIITVVVRFAGRRHADHYSKVCADIKKADTNDLESVQNV
ncbi:hypothetical protein DPMN_009477 [Dreissena polymorpha]|uniref:Uncharacterized protein n=1 Tax=Dreissena polymorpha TaxID=45954 RepID=A0A9D4MX22_DREPO|nr:hypothetical protein DPMN_009477 [Dreissena polymorpha]